MTCESDNISTLLNLSNIEYIKELIIYDKNLEKYNEYILYFNDKNIIEIKIFCVRPSGTIKKILKINKILTFSSDMYLNKYVEIINNKKIYFTTEVSENDMRIEIFRK